MKNKIKKSDTLLSAPDDVTRVRKRLEKDQKGIDPITKEPLVSPCLDHAHDATQQVRGVISREINVLVGKIENTYTRNIKYWCCVPLPDILRRVADYLEQEYLPIVHPGWKKKCITAFNKLSAAEKDKVLKSFNTVPQGKPNPAKRSAAFKKLLASRSVTYGEILEEINNVTQQWLIDRGITPASSQAKRREQITNVLKEEIK